MEKLYNKKYFIWIIIFFIFISIVSYLAFYLGMKTNLFVQSNNKSKEELINDADNDFSNKNYPEAIIKYEKILDNWIVTEKLINNLFISYINESRYKDAQRIIFYLISLNWNNERLVWSIIEENNLSENIYKYQEILKNQENRKIEDIIKYAELLYDAWDYYYNKDQQKYFFAIFLHYLSAYLALEDWIEINPKNSELYYLQWRLIMDIWGNISLAEKKLKIAVSLNSKDYRYYYRLWNAYMEQNKNLLARDAFIKWLSLNNNFEKLYLNLGIIYFKLWDREKWYLNYNLWLKICSNECSSFYNNLWNEKLNDWDIKLSKEYYLKALELNPNNEHARNNLRKFGNK